MNTRKSKCGTWEYNDISVDAIAEVEFGSFPRKAGGTYNGAQLFYSFNGKPEQKTIHENGYTGKNEKLKTQLEAIKPRDKILIKRYRKVGEKFWNIDSIEKVDGIKAVGNTATGSSTGSTQQGSFSSVNPAEVGQCLNLAVQLGLAKSYSELSSPAVMQEAIALYKGVKKQYTDNWDNAEAVVQQANSPEENGIKVTESFEVLDDDIPF